MKDGEGLWAELVAEVGPAAVGRLKHYAELLEQWGRCHNLVRFKSRQDLVDRHLREAIALCRHMGEEGRLLDVGSGAGIPGVPILCVKRAWRGVLLEPRSKRWAFLKTAVRELGLSAEAVRQRFEDYRGEFFDVITARAVGRHEDVLKWATGKLNEGGFVALWATEREETKLRSQVQWHVLSSPILGLKRGRLLRIQPSFT